jgi:hypothetical protein
MFFAVSDVARELGVNESRVRALIAADQLDAAKIGGRWLVDSAAVAQRKREPSSPGRPLSPRNAWALLLAASQEELVDGIDPVAQWRIRQSLAHIGLHGLRGRLGGRGRPSMFQALPGELRALRERQELVFSGSSAAGAHQLELVAPDAIDAYVPASRLEPLIKDHALGPASATSANVILRAVPDDAWLLAGRRVAPIAAVALDLATYPDPRSSRVGIALLDRFDRERKSAR